MSEVDVKTEITIARPLSVVAEFAGNPENAPQWYVNIKAVELKTPLPIAQGSKVAFVAQFMGKRLAYTYEFVEWVAGERLVMKTSEGPFPMETTYEWTPVGKSETRMTLRNRGRPSGFSAIMTPFMAAMMKRANRKDLARLRALLEANELQR